MAADKYTIGNGFHGMWVWVPEICEVSEIHLDYSQYGTLEEA